MLSTQKTITLLLFFCSAILFAQVDSKEGNKKSDKIRFKAKVTTAEKPEEINPTSKSGFETAYNKEQEKIRKKTEEENLKNKGILDKARQQEENLTKKFRKLNSQFLFPRVDQDLGSFRSNTNSINIICRDFQYPDGDRVTILVNDEPYILDITLEQRYQKFSIPLNIGANKIAFKALNQGSSGPNTAAFKVYDENGELLSANEWNLATGAKATLLIVKDK
ncbi:hypothetical protein N9V96_00365 [Polaribacter sp.]|nr:hypothetical protein [Polaribacter sp.]